LHDLGCAACERGAAEESHLAQAESDIRSDRLPVVLTVARQLASGGAYIGQRVARRLNLQYVDRELLTRASAAWASRTSAP
jgi:hypothetical protein